MNRLILPHGAERVQQMDNVRAVPEGGNQPKFNLPQEMKDEVRKHVPEAKEVATKLHELLSKGQAAQVAFVCQETTRAFLGEHIRSLLPQMSRTFAHVDRMQILNFFRQISEQRLSPDNLSAERIDRKTYELALNDFMSLISRVPAQIFPIEVGLPDLDLEETSPSEGETQQNTTQGES
jgi:hypothetical protein